ncbi:hypothetical protein E2C01_096569 [Portunus trituberculatus]|uniref:Uncharacterized protein n=1 Tax=Portunus trituberculatus TaxID=210409 RepID=A0A5B7K3F0_PORTR|nr:hypothetical protein [Portunus trituberculatus]
MCGKVKTDSLFPFTIAPPPLLCLIPFPLSFLSVLRHFLALLGFSLSPSLLPSSQHPPLFLSSTSFAPNTFSSSSSSSSSSSWHHSKRKLMPHHTLTASLPR